jgi:hypothetical protein
MNWPLTFFVTNLPVNCGGRTNLFVIRIPEKYKGDVSKQKHEEQHVWQWFTFFLLFGVLGLIAMYIPSLVAFKQFSLIIGLLFGAAVHPALYTIYKPYRQWAEAKAYKVQMGLPDLTGHQFTLDEAAFELSTTYNLGITIDQAKVALQ